MLFGNKNKMTEKELKNREEENRKIDQQVEIYRQQKLLEVDKTVENYRKQEFKKVEQLAVDCLKETVEYEHTYHHGMETKKVELAQLDAEIKSKKETLEKMKSFEALQESNAKYKAESDASKMIIESKDKAITLLDDIVKVVVGKLSTVDVKNLAVNVSPTKE